MCRALTLAARGEGWVEPNPMVGAVVVDDELRNLGEGYHQRYGEPHAEIHALQAAGEQACGATLYVSLEPCCHQGKTGPCTEAIIAAGIRRVVVAAGDPFPKVSGGGIRRLREAGLDVEVGLLQAEAETLTAPFRKLVTTGQPWVIGKWAMTADGKLATRNEVSKWISNSLSREGVRHRRGRMDAILVGIGTVLSDDPQLTARPSGPRVALRVVIDRDLQIPIESQLVRTARAVPVLVFAGSNASESQRQALSAAGVDVETVPHAGNGHLNVPGMLSVLGQRGVTNLLVEGGAGVLGSFFDARTIDEVHIFMAPKLFGGTQALSPIGGVGLANPEMAPMLLKPKAEIRDGDIHLSGRVRYA